MNFFSPTKQGDSLRTWLVRCADCSGEVAVRCKDNPSGLFAIRCYACRVRAFA